MANKKNFELTYQVNTKTKKQNKRSNKVKSYIITEDQIRSLYLDFTSSDALEETLIKVKNNGQFWFEFDNAYEDYCFKNDEDFKKEYENIENSCKEDEIVVYQYTPLSLQQMLDRIKEKINNDFQEDDWSASGITVELYNLILLKDIIEQNI